MEKILSFIAALEAESSMIASPAELSVEAVEDGAEAPLQRVQ